MKTYIEGSKLTPAQRKVVEQYRATRPANSGPVVSIENCMWAFKKDGSLLKKNNGLQKTYKVEFNLSENGSEVVRWLDKVTPCAITVNSEGVATLPDPTPFKLEFFNVKKSYTPDPMFSREVQRLLRPLPVRWMRVTFKDPRLATYAKLVFG